MATVKKTKTFQYPLLTRPKCHMLKSCSFGSLVEMDFYQLTSNSDILSGGHGRALRIKRPVVDFFCSQ